MRSLGADRERDALKLDVGFWRYLAINFGFIVALTLLLGFIVNAD